MQIQTSTHRGQAPERPSDARRTQGGFSLIEVTIVIAIVLIIAAVGLPRLMNTIYLSRARGAAVDLSGLVQQARILAERNNTTLAVYVGSVETNDTGGFINCSRTSCPTGGNGTTWQTGDPDVPFAGGVVNGSASGAPAALNPGFTAEAAGTTLYFGPRGLPAKPSGTTYVASNGVIFYLTDAHGDWAAVSVSGAGRSKVWMWTGKSWN